MVLKKSVTQYICLDEQSGIKMIPPQTSTDHALATLNFQIFSRLKHKHLKVYREHMRKAL